MTPADLKAIVERHAEVARYRAAGHSDPEGIDGDNAVADRGALLDLLRELHQRQLTEAELRAMNGPLGGSQ